MLAHPNASWVYDGRASLWDLSATITLSGKPLQVLVPGRQNLSLVIAWQLDHDPLDAIARALPDPYADPDLARDAEAAGEASVQEHGNEGTGSSAPCCCVHARPPQMVDGGMCETELDVKSAF